MKGIMDDYLYGVDKDKINNITESLTDEYTTLMIIK